MERIPSGPGQDDEMNHFPLRGMNFKKPFVIDIIRSNATTDANISLL